MSDQHALRAAICAQPDEDTPRLVYADWLDEHGGKAGAKRAAYIRGEIADYHAERADTPANAFLTVANDHERVDWAAVDADLAACFAAEKAADKRRLKLTFKGEGVPRVTGVEYMGPERGFFSCVWVRDPAAFLRHADDIFRAAPIIELVFETLNAEQAADLVSSGHLAEIRELELREPVDADALRAIGAARDAGGVRKLTVPLGTNGTATLAALAAGEFWAGLHELHATSYRSDPGGTSPDAVTDLLAANPFPNLRELHAWATLMNDDGAKLIARNFPELRFADIAINEITNTGAAAIAASKTLRHLRHLDLGACDLAGESTAATSLVVTNNLPNLTVLKVENCSFRPRKTPVKGARGPGLRSLAFSAGSFSPEGVEALLKCPAVRGLWHLDLSITSLGDDHIERFARHAAFDRLTSLDLGYNDFGARGAKALAAWPGAASLQWLELTRTNLGEAGAKALAASPHLAGLKHIRFSGRGTGTLKKRFKKAFEE